MRYQYFLFFILFSYSSSLIAQNNVQFIAKTNIKEVAKGEIFEISYQANTNDFQDFNPPKFQHFKVVGGPNRSTQTTISNGQISSNVSIAYTLLAQDIGAFTIPSARIKLDKNWYKSNTLHIKVTKEKATPATSDISGQDIFLRIEISSDTAYVGEQIIVDYVLYSNVQTRGTSVIDAPDYGDFYVESPRLFPRTPQRLTINDEIFESKIIQRLALFPQFPGVYNLDPIIANVRVALEGGSRSPFSLFQPTKSVNVSSEKATIVVTSIPPAEPNGFTGAVGDYSIVPSVNRTAVKQNQAISLRIKMRGNGDPKKLKAPDLSLPDHVQLYEPKLINDDLTESQGEIIGTRTYEYVLVPSEIGTLNLDFDLTYFHPDSTDFVLVNYAPLTIEVSEGTAESDGEAILYDQTTESIDGKKNTIWRWGIPLAALLLLLGLAWIFKFKNKDKSPIIEEINWEERARKYLSTAHENIHNNNGSDFYESIRNGIYGYVAQKLSLPISELTQEKAISKLKSEGVEESIIAEIEQIIQRSEMALFAGLNKETDRQHMYDQAVRLLGSLEEIFDQS